MDEHTTKIPRNKGWLKCLHIQATLLELKFEKGTYGRVIVCLVRGGVQVYYDASHQVDTPYVLRHGHTIRLLAYNAGIVLVRSENRHGLLRPPFCTYAERKIIIVF